LCATLQPMTTRRREDRRYQRPLNNSEMDLPKEPARAANVLRRGSLRPFSSSRSVLFAIPLWDGKVGESPAARFPQLPDSAPESDLQRSSCLPCHRTDSTVYNIFPRYRYSRTLFMAEFSTAPAPGRGVDRSSRSRHSRTAHRWFSGFLR
jgi:hypothetical protein